MPRYAIRVAYDGTHYHGWQRQQGVPTVQATLEQCLTTLLREPITLFAAGRTDTGVHAKGQVAHFDTSQEDLVSGRILLGSKALLPRDIVIKELFHVKDDFHARFDAQWRQYRYRILRQSSPFERDLAWVVYPWPETTLLIQAASVLSGEHDFTAFCKADSALETNRCTIMHAEWEFINQEGVDFVIRANRFLHHMVRGLVGTMIRQAQHENIKEFNELIDQGIRSEAVFTAPAKGLFLEEIGYIKENH